MNSIAIRIVFGLTILYCLSCSNNNSKRNLENETGESLAKVYCGSCHMAPMPELLPKSIWANSVLPNMAVRLGIGDKFTFLKRYPHEELMNLGRMGILPNNPTLSQSEFDKISEYYLSNAPDSLTSAVAKEEEITKTFSKKVIDLLEDRVVSTYDHEGSVIVSTENPSRLVNLGADFVQMGFTSSDSPIVQTEIIEGDTVKLLIGKLDPSDLAKGSLRINDRNLIENLKRPVFFHHYDIDGDTTSDWLIGNFGNEKGSLSWYNGKSLEETILLDAPGCRIAYILDFDKDGFDDIVALFTQSNEQLVLFKGDGKGNFDEKLLLRFPPVYGSSFFELVDMNNDGLLDVVLSNGDNADLSQVYKPYHGVRIFENQKDEEFKEVYFLPINGASKVMCADMDLDGDMDVNVISFFPDATLNEGFRYLENEGDYKFKSQIIPGVSEYSWLTLELFDIGEDGDMDIVLGGYKRSISATSRVQNGRPNLMVLTNKHL